jgi:alpha-glucosidase
VWTSSENFEVSQSSRQAEDDVDQTRRSSTTQGKGNIDKEPWAFGPEVEETSRLAIQRRYRLMPYIYTLFHDASTNGAPVVRPLFFLDPKDSALRSEDDSFLLGGDLLVVPQLVPDRTRVPVMPRGNWRELAWQVPTDGKNTTVGLDSQNDDLPKLFVRPGAIVPTGPLMEWTNQKALDPVTLIMSLDDAGKAAGTMYEDAGDGYAYKQGQFLATSYVAQRTGNTVKVQVQSVDGKLSRAKRGITIRLLLDGGKEVIKTGVDGETIELTID